MLGGDNTAGALAWAASRSLLVRCPLLADAVSLLLTSRSKSQTDDFLLSHMCLCASPAQAKGKLAQLAQSPTGSRVVQACVKVGRGN